VDTPDGSGAVLVTHAAKLLEEARGARVPMGVPKARVLSVVPGEGALLGGVGPLGGRALWGPWVTGGLGSWGQALKGNCGSCFFLAQEVSRCHGTLPHQRPRLWGHWIVKRTLQHHEPKSTFTLNKFTSSGASS
jgi:hypothetical protein